MSNTHIPAISVIVPVYNVEKHLNKCINSILNQTFTDFELILIDDGSKDDSGNICDDFAAKDSRIVVKHQKNSGVSASRNKGIELSQGEYIMFVDSDDTIDPEYFEEAYTQIKQSNADVHISGISIEKVVDDKVVEVTTHTINDTKIYSSRDFFENMYIDFQPGSLLGCYRQLFFSSIIRQNNIRFPEEMNYGEDVFFTLSFLKKANRIYFSKKCYYHYYKYESTTLSNRFNPNICESLEKVNNKMKRVMEAKACSDRTMSKFNSLYFSALVSGLCSIYRHKKQTTLKFRLQKLKIVAKNDIVKKVKAKDINHIKLKTLLILFKLKLYLFLEVCFSV